MITGHTVRILADYDGLHGYYGKVLRDDHGDGKVLVEVHLCGGNPRSVCFLSYEVAVVPGNDTLRDTGEEMAEDQEVYLLIERSSRLQVDAREYSPALATAMRARAKRLHDTIRCLQRARNVRQAHKMVGLIGDPCCSALVMVPGQVLLRRAEEVQEGQWVKLAHIKRLFRCIEPASERNEWTCCLEGTGPGTQWLTRDWVVEIHEGRIVDVNDPVCARMEGRAIA